MVYCLIIRFTQIREHHTKIGLPIPGRGLTINTMMKILLAFAGIILSTWAAVPHEKIAKIFFDMDYNGNDVIIENEIIPYFQQFKNSLQDTIIQKTVFVKKWMSLYKDSQINTELLYGKFDANGDGILSDSDIPVLFKELDKNRNGIEWPEFEKAFNEWYSEI